MGEVSERTAKLTWPVPSHRLTIGDHLLAGPALLPDWLH
jgi:hypothetical protein